MRETLEKLSKKELIDFVVEYVEGDPKLANALAVAFREPDHEQELRKIEYAIDRALWGIADYRRRDYWGYVDIDVSDIKAEIMLRAKQGHIRLAFAELELLYCRLLGLFGFQSECEISDEAECCLGMMHEIAGEATLQEDKEFIFGRCLELADFDEGAEFGADYVDRLLGIAAKFVTLDNLQVLEELLSQVDICWREEEFALIRLEIIRRIEGDGAAEGFIAENLQFPRIREIAFNEAMLNKNYAQAEQLCIGASDGKRSYYGISPWLYRLLSVYEATTDTAKVIEITERILLSGDLELYSKLKVLLIEQAMWDNAYPELLNKCEAELSHTSYMKILEEEGEYALLLEQVQSHAREVYQYGRLLAQVYPFETRRLFIEQLNKEATRAYGRSEYWGVCMNIACFAEAGFTADAVLLTSEYMKTYSRKPAFVDELRKLQLEPVL